MEFPTSLNICLVPLFGLLLPFLVCEKSIQDISFLIATVMDLTESFHLREYYLFIKIMCAIICIVYYLFIKIMCAIICIVFQEARLSKSWKIFRFTLEICGMKIFRF